MEEKEQRIERRLTADDADRRRIKLGRVDRALFDRKSGRRIKAY